MGDFAARHRSVLTFSGCAVCFCFFCGCVFSVAVSTPNLAPLIFFRSSSLIETETPNLSALKKHKKQTINTEEKETRDQTHCVGDFQ